MASSSVSLSHHVSRHLKDRRHLGPSPRGGMSEPRRSNNRVRLAVQNVLQKGVLNRIKGRNSIHPGPEVAQARSENSQKTTIKRGSGSTTAPSCAEEPLHSSKQDPAPMADTITVNVRRRPSRNRRRSSGSLQFIQNIFASSHSDSLKTEESVLRQASSFCSKTATSHELELLEPLRKQCCKKERRPDINGEFTVYQTLSLDLVFQSPQATENLHEIAEYHFVGEITRFLELANLYAQLPPKRQFRRYHDVITDCIKPGSPNEINISAQTRSKVLLYSAFSEQMWNTMSLAKRKCIFESSYSEAQHLLFDNIQSLRSLNKMCLEMG